MGVSCNFSYTVAHEFPRLTQGWMYAKNSMLTKIFDREMQHILEKGIDKKLLHEHELDCPSDDFTSVGLDFVMILFIILIIGLIFAVIIFIVEKNFLKNQAEKASCPRPRVQKTFM